MYRMFIKRRHYDRNQRKVWLSHLGPGISPAGPRPPLQRPLPHRARPAATRSPRAPPGHAPGRRVGLSLRGHAPGRPFHGPQLSRCGPASRDAAPLDAHGGHAHGGRAQVDAPGRSVAGLHGLPSRFLPQPRGSVLEEQD